MVRCLICREKSRNWRSVIWNLGEMGYFCNKRLWFSKPITLFHNEFCKKLPLWCLCWSWSCCPGPCNLTFVVGDLHSALEQNKAGFQLHASDGTWDFSTVLQVCEVVSSMCFQHLLFAPPIFCNLPASTPVHNIAWFRVPLWPQQNLTLCAKEVASSFQHVIFPSQIFNNAYSNMALYATHLLAIRTESWQEDKQNKVRGACLLHDRYPRQLHGLDPASKNKSPTCQCNKTLLQIISYAYYK